MRREFYPLIVINFKTPIPTFLVIAIAWFLDGPSSPALDRERSGIHHSYHAKDTQSNIRQSLPPGLCDRFKMKKGLPQALATSEGTHQG